MNFNKIFNTQIFHNILIDNKKREFWVDKRTDIKWIAFDDLESASKLITHSVKHNNLCIASINDVKFMMKESDKSSITIIQDKMCLNFTTVMIAEDKMAMLKNVSAQNVYDLLEVKPPKFSVSFKDAEYHSYVEFQNLATGAKKAIGTTVFPFSQTIGAKILRHDDVYDQKYFKGNILSLNGTENPKYDKASNSVTFLVDQDQIEAAKNCIIDIYKNIDSSKEESKNLLEKKSFFSKMQVFLQNYLQNKEQYHFFANNCHSDVHKIYKSMNLPGHYIKFIPADMLDLRDIGKIYDLWRAYCSYTMLINAYQSCKDMLIQKTASSYIPKLTYHYNKLFNHHHHDYDDNNILQQAIISGDEKFAIELIKKVNLMHCNKRGETAIHTAASSKMHKLLDALITEIKNKGILDSIINQVDLYGDYVPLAFAVMADDPVAIDMLYKNGGNPYYQNATQDNLASIAAMYGSYNALAALEKIDHKLLHFDNKTRQIPAFITDAQDKLQYIEKHQKEAAAKDEASEYLAINSESEINEIFDALIAMPMIPATPE